MLQLPKIDRITPDSERDSVNHYILTQRVLKRCSKIQVPEPHKHGPFIEDLENRILEMSFKRLVEVSKTQNDADFIQMVRLDRSKTLN